MPLTSPLTLPTPADLACWSSEEISDWLTALEDDDRVTDADADVAYARAAVNHHYGID